MNITLIGTGNVAYILGRLLVEKSYTVTQVAGRTKEKAQNLAALLNADATGITNLNTSSDLYIIAVADKAVEAVAGTLILDNKPVVHTCGSVGISVLNKCSKKYGVLYPLQSIRKETTHIPDIPFLIDGNTNEVKNKLHHLASSLSLTVDYADDNKRLLYHLAAVVSSNFSNYLYLLSQQFCNNNKLDFTLLIPLIKETANRLEHYQPETMQTGPAVRNDITTIRKHIDALTNEPELLALYIVFTNAILQHYHHPLLKYA